MIKEPMFISPRTFKGYEQYKTDCARASGWNEAMAVLVEDINSAPTIEIIRCRECKAYDSECEWCGGLGLGMKPDDFCSYGSRSEKPNNCETCKWWEGNTNFCYSKADSDDHACHYEPKDKWREERSSE